MFGLLHIIYYICIVIKNLKNKNMELQEINLKNLKRVSTYAKIKDVTTVTVFRWIKEQTIKTITIDKTVFVILED
jgi:hypothetical protein